MEAGRLIMDQASSAKSSGVVFIVSQPRAGSTLLQTMLAGHPCVVAPGETWMMLPLVCAIGSSRRESSSHYSSALADDAISCFAAENLSHGLSDIHRELGIAAANIYHSVRSRHAADVIIDKTPRYYWIIEDLLRFIPDCRIILLKRNPLAVLSSIISTWAKDALGNLYSHRADLLEAPSRLANAVQLRDERILTVQYEELVSTPAHVLESIQQFLGLRIVNGLEVYGKAASRSFGDPVGIHQHQMAHIDSVDKWLFHASSSPVAWKLLDDYRKMLGCQLFARFGYDFEEASAGLRLVKPRGVALAPSLHLQLKKKPIEPLRSIIRLRNSCAMKLTDLRRQAA